MNDGRFHFRQGAPCVILLGALALASLASGCMTSRGVCCVSATGEVGRAATVNRYRISQIRERLPGGRFATVHADRRMREMLDGASRMDELTSYTSGVWSRDGIPVTVTFSNWRKDGDVHWTLVPCLLTLGICPYCHHDEIASTVEVSRDGDGKTATFEYIESDDWKMSLLFGFGLIPYAEKTIARNEFQVCGRGDILSRPHLEGLSHGIAAALAELERVSPITPKKER